MLVLAVLVVFAAAVTTMDRDEVDRADVAGQADDGGQPDADRPRSTDLSADRSSRSMNEHDGRWAVFARYEDLQLRLLHPEPVGVRFTEGRRVGAVPLEPVGELTANANPENFDPDVVRASPNGPQFAVAADAGRGRPATSAGVITVPRGEWVGAPVYGEVAAVDEFHRPAGVDYAVILTPQDRSDLHVTVTGLHRPAVAPGDEVEPGDILAVPRLGPAGQAEVDVEAGPASAPTTWDLDEP